MAAVRSSTSASSGTMLGPVELLKMHAKTRPSEALRLEGLPGECRTFDPRPVSDKRSELDGDDVEK